MIVASNSVGIIETGVAYLELDPVYMCYMNSEPSIQVFCTREDICSGNTVRSWDVDYGSMFSLKNWIVELDLYCTPKEYIGYIGSMVFAGAFISCFFLPVLGDKYGRWIVFQGSIIAQIPLTILLCLVKQLWAIYFWYFFVGVC